MDENCHVSDADITKYITCSKICKNIINELVQKIYDGEDDVLELRDFADNKIIVECEKIYKKVKNKGIAFPTSISLNDCVGNYIYEKDNDRYNKIKEGDIVKIDLGVNIDGCIIILGETIVKLNKEKNESNQYDDNEDIQAKIRYIAFLNELKEYVLENIKQNETNDEIRIHIESKCTDNDCFPLKNTISYQHTNSNFKSDMSKYMILNYTRSNEQKYNENDMNEIENFCFDFCENEVYTVNLIITPNNDNLQLYEKHEPHIYRFNEYYNGLKLKMSREFCSKVKSIHGTNAFNCIPYKEISKYRVGVRECTERNILESFPIMYTKNKDLVFCKKFTIIVKKNNAKEL